MDAIAQPSQLPTVQINTFFKFRVLADLKNYLTFFLAFKLPEIMETLKMSKQKQQKVDPNLTFILETINCFLKFI